MKCVCYNRFLVYCRELAPGTVSLTGDWAQGDDSKHDLHYSVLLHNCKQSIASLSLFAGRKVDVNVFRKCYNLTASFCSV